MCCIFVLICIYSAFVEILGSDCGHGYDKYYYSPGDVHIVGLFNAHKDGNCSVPNGLSLQQMYNIAVTVKLLNDIDYISGITIGMSLYDTCILNETAKKSFMSSVANSKCNSSYNLGIFTSKYISNMIESFSTTSDVPVYALNYSPNLDMLMRISVELLMELKFSSIDLAVFPNSDLVQQFNKLTVDENICIKKSTTFIHYDGTCPGNDMVLIIAITAAELSPLLKLEMDCMSTFVIIILDNNIDLSSLTEHLLLHEAYIIISSNIWPEFAIAVEDNFQTIVTTIQENIHFSNVTMDFIRTASLIISVVDRMKEKMKNECGFDDDIYSVCSNLTKFHKSDEFILKNDSTFSVPQILGIDKKKIMHYLILKSHFSEMNNFGEIRIVENNVHIKFVNPVFPKETTDCDSHDENCRNCSNFIEHDNTSEKFIDVFEGNLFTVKSDGWAFSFLTVCIIGIITCCCVFAFIITRVCKEDILEGNPSSTFLLIGIAIFMYIMVFPFCVRAESKIMCVFKLFGTSMSYCMLFSIIFSRVLMILTCDYNGSFMSHINGYLQSFLCFFMFAVQFGLILEFWIFGWILSNVDYCSKFSNNYFLTYMLYDTFLLILIASVVPFVTKSRRNYREGLCFTILSVCLVLIWLLWSFGYFLASSQWKDFFAAFGLTATATSVIVCVLIPRTYFIVTGMVRDQITSAIPSNISNLVDMNYRSTQALYDSVRIDAVKRGELNTGFYEEPRTSLNASQEDIYGRTKSNDNVLSDQDNFDSCSVSQTGQKITKF